ncbi:hypothetical protein FRB95_006593 [Tulasnella sp. JGI-2019a]|nr:hypothetical protein FRB95_006593 [Tulasnella sp. JGI-2019a]
MSSPSSPTLSSVSIGEDEWDLISGGSESVGFRSPSAPASTAGDDFDSDGERETTHHIEAFHDIASPTDELDEEDAVEDAVLRESDRRVEAALASSLSSTLEPFRQPLPAYLTRSISSSISSGLVLSFPDPLTPSQELQAAQARAAGGDSPLIDTPPHTDDGEHKAPDVVEEVVIPLMESPEPLPSQTAEVDPITESAQSPAAEALTEPKAAPTEEFIPLKREVKDLRKIAYYVPRKRTTNVVRRRLSTGNIAQLLQGPTTPHSWTTSIVLSLLALMLGSTLFATRTYVSSLASKQALVTPEPSSLPLKTIDTYVTAGHVQQAIPVVVESSSTAALLETPGAGPSAISSAKAQRSAMPSTKGLIDAMRRSSAVDPMPSMDLNSGLIRSATRSNTGCARPSATPSSFWSKANGKGKEKEVVNVWNYWGEEPEEEHQTFLLDGPSGLPTSLSRAFQGFKATVLGHTFSTELLALSGLDWLANFEQVLDALIARIIIQTSSILNEVSSLVTNHASAIISSAPVQSACDSIIKHSERVKDNTRKIARAVHAHHKRAEANVRKTSRRVEKALKEHATDLSIKVDVGAVVEGVKAHHERVRKNVRKGRKMMKKSLRNAMNDGQRFLADALGKPEAMCGDERERKAESV